MLYGLYLSAQGAQNQSLRLQTIANNMANADTTGFKRDLAVFQDHLPFDLEHGQLTHPPGELNRSTGGTTAAFTETDFTNGPLMKTGGTFDVALAGEGFLQVKNGNETLLTRNGQMTVNDLGEIVTQDEGWPILNTDGTSIIIPANLNNITISADGVLTGDTPDGTQLILGQLNRVQPESLQSLEKLGNSLYRPRGSVLPADPALQIKQGFLEASAVKPIGETVQLIEATKAFETNINMIRFQDETLSRLFQSMTR